MKARWIPILLLVCVGLAALLAVPVTRADDDRSALVGTWRLNVGGTPNEFFSIVVFSESHTMTERVSETGFTMGSGVWEEIDDRRRRRSKKHSRRSRRNDFAAMFEGFGDVDSDGAFDTRFRVRMTLEVDGDMISGTATLDFLTVDGTDFVAEPFPLLVIQGTRMTVIRE